MKRLKTLLLGFSSFLLITSCWNNEDPLKAYQEWRKNNETYFLSYKDSTNFSKIEIREDNGGRYIYCKKIREASDRTIVPMYTDRVRVHYKGLLMGQEIFDATYLKDEPNEYEIESHRAFSVNGVVPGFGEALQLMSVGDKWRIVIPMELGYGDSFQNVIPPYSTLIFEIELLAINP